MMNTKPRLLIFIDWYYPAFKAGGPVQSCINLVRLLQPFFEIFVVTGNNDLGDEAPLSVAAFDKWVAGPYGEKVIYQSAATRTFRTIKDLVSEVNPSAVYLNSMFSFSYSILPSFALRKLKLPVRLVLAPRGMLHPGALGLKSAKKKVFLHLFKLLSFHKDIVFHATNSKEAGDIKKWFSQSQVYCAQNIPRQGTDRGTPVVKQKGFLKLVHIARIHPTKGLDFLIKVLGSFNNNERIELDIFGPIEQEVYWHEIKRLIQKLPVSIKVQYHGPIAGGDIPSMFSGFHALAMPTLGENFGHVIFESLAEGRPVLISDRTPWVKLEARKAGWDLPLQSEPFQLAISSLLSMDQKEYDKWSAGALQAAEEYMKSANYLENYLQLFKDENRSCQIQ